MRQDIPGALHEREEKDEGFPALPEEKIRKNRQAPD